MGKERERTRIRSRVDDFPEALRERLNEMLRDTRYTYQDIADEMTDKGYSISTSAVHRYAMRTNTAAKRLQEAAEQTQILVQQIKENVDVEAAEVATALLMDGLTHRLASAQDEYDSLPLYKAGQLLVQVQRSNVYKNRYKQDRKNTIAALEGNIMARIRDAVQDDDALLAALTQHVKAAAKEEATRENG